MKTRVDSPQRFISADGRTIYLLCLEIFPGFFGNVFLVDDGERRILIDTGSWFEGSRRGLEDGLGGLEPAFGVHVSLADVDCVLITHAHMDHFGGLSFVRERTEAPVGIHPLDRRVLSHYEERVVVASKQLRIFLARSGLSVQSVDSLMQMYLAPKGHFGSLPVDFLIEGGAGVRAPLAGGEADLGIDVFHVPGHCPGQVCLRVGDVLLSADHVLSRTTPHQSPESITLSMGLRHYLDSLRAIRAVDGVRIALGGHEEPIEDLPARVDEICQAHDRRLDRVLEACVEPRTTADVSRELFGGVHGYNVLLALEETGAHVEYLYHLGELVAANVDEIALEDDAAVRYVRA
ncbi:MAG TPA: MBL fold metallo-hydrolase [Thermoanaerobaculia bacterium]|nr:MBL fold metallo-hydrolase [Thermoanaerobaculia bacterium]